MTASPSEVEMDARRWGLDPALFQTDDEDGLWEAHIPALNAFLTVATQWRMIPRANGSWAHLGLDYAGARHGLAMARLKVSPDLWADVQMIEAGAVAALNRKM